MTSTPERSTPSAAAVAAKDAQPPEVRPVGRARLLIGFAAGALWLALLAAFALLTANPVTLSVEQIRRSDAIVSATVSPRDHGKVVVEKVWAGDLELGELRVSNLSKAGARSGRSYLMPLSRSAGDRYAITASQLPGRIPLLYPATQEAIEQLTAILRN